MSKMTDYTIENGVPQAVRVRTQAFGELSARELYEILKVRAEVFIMEQQCRYQDMDDRDFDATHVTLLDGSDIVAYARVFSEGHPDAWHIGRVLTVRRGVGYGIPLMQAAIGVAREAGARYVEIDSQSYAVGFYEKVGFRVVSHEEYLIDGILHKRMRLQFS